MYIIFSSGETLTFICNEEDILDSIPETSQDEKEIGNTSNS